MSTKTIADNRRYADLRPWNESEYVSPAQIEKEFGYSQTRLRELRNDPSLHFPKRYGTSRKPRYRRKRVEWWFRNILGKDKVTLPCSKNDVVKERV